MHVLGRMIEAVKPEGLILDLQVIRPDPPVERDGCIVAWVDYDPVFQWADAATAAVDARIEAGYLVDENPRAAPAPAPSLSEARSAHGETIGWRLMVTTRLRQPTQGTSAPPYPGDDGRRDTLVRHVRP